MKMKECVGEACKSAKENVTKVFKSGHSYSHNSNYGIGFVGLLTILFIGLKLTGDISWSWWWVLSPLWISVLLGIGIFLLFIIIFKLLMSKS